MIQGFREFILRGNLVDLAVGFIIGAAFSTVVKSFTDNLVMPVIGMFGGVPDFRSLGVSVNGSVFKYGAFLTDLLSFLLTAAVLYFFVVRPFTAMLNRFAKPEAPAAPTRQEVLLTEIRDAIRGQSASRPFGDD
ncbi:large conductance mechanosensitive channel protein MscL [Deinococcus yavapaiensis]|uniref:Large-conductance mechanosensitive channel n=1 Tax=Deinococcus yavapaiensis KR-236 TaxID=694435 RepID=A0A318SFT3_9DEIO|nr:large conductance mechanosensitive channel protein MscL [Deinococcus yavapaiensis]PYE55726.1 large conductance mechanosensitive channel [Deinococcus yavapaiensis KR-236]